MCCDVTSLYPNRLWNTGDVGLLFISFMLMSVRVFMWLYVRNCVFLHVSKCRCSDVRIVLLSVCVWESKDREKERERQRGPFLLNFQRIQTVHTLLQHITLWHPTLGMVHAVLTQLSPSLSHFPVLFYWELSSVAQYALFVEGCISLEQLSWGVFF